MVRMKKLCLQKSTNSTRTIFKYLYSSQAVNTSWRTQETAADFVAVVFSHESCALTSSHPNVLKVCHWFYRTESWSSQWIDSGVKLIFLAHSGRFGKQERDTAHLDRCCRLAQSVLIYCPHSCTSVVYFASGKRSWRYRGVAVAKYGNTERI